MFFGWIFFKCCSSADTLFVFNHLWLKLPKKVCTTSYWNFLDTLYWNPYRSYLHLHLIYEMAQNEETRNEPSPDFFYCIHFKGQLSCDRFPNPYNVLFELLPFEWGFRHKLPWPLIFSEVIWSKTRTRLVFLDLFMF